MTASANQRGFWHSLFLWLQQVAVDRELPPMALNVATIIAGYVNTRTGDAWPTQETLARTLSTIPRVARRCVGELVSRGHLEVTVFRGRHKPNHYRPIWKKNPSPADTQKPDRTDLFSAPENRTQQARKPDSNSQKNRTPETSRTYRRKESKTLSNARGRARGVSDPPGFEEWYRCYPRHVARGDAAKSYQKAVDQGVATPSELLAGCMRYAAEREGQDPKFTKHPATWLNKQCWLDEPAAAAPRATTGFASVLAGLAAIPDDDDGGQS